MLWQIDGVRIEHHQDVDLRCARQLDAFFIVHKDHENFDPDFIEVGQSEQIPCFKISWHNDKTNHYCQNLLEIINLLKTFIQG